MAEAKRKNPDDDYYGGPENPMGSGELLARMREMDRTDPDRFLRAQGQTGSDEEYEAALILEARRDAMLEEARAAGIPFTLSDCATKDLDTLEAKLANYSGRRMPRPPKTEKQGEVTENFCQAHFARVVDLAQDAPVTITRQGQPLIVVLSPAQYAVLSAGHPIPQPGFAKHLLGDLDAQDLTLTEKEVEDNFRGYL